MAPRRSRILYAILADDHKQGDRGKVDALGIFTRIEGWATPFSRECSVVLGIDDTKAGDTPISFWLRRRGSSRRQLARGHINFSEARAIATIGYRIAVPILRFGHHEMGVTLGNRPGTANTVWVPFYVHELPWPTLPSGRALRVALADPHTMKSARILLECRSCGKAYIFQKNLDPKKPLPARAGSKRESEPYARRVPFPIQYLTVTSDITSHWFTNFVALAST
jgi:hypothetical protein